MKPTKGNKLKFVRGKLAVDRAWALKALVRIYSENQTADEQSAQITKHDNGIGFSGIDANFLSSLAVQYKTRGTLSEKQMVFVMKKLPKYAGQVMTFIGEPKLTELVEAAV